MTMYNIATCAAWLAGLALLPMPAHAQAGEDFGAVGEGEAARTSLRERLGARRGEELLDAPDPETRIRGIERLAADGSEEAIAALADAMAPGTALRADPKTRLAAVVALAPHATTEQVRRVLSSVLTSVRSGAPETALELRVRASAALALAKAGTNGTLTPLVAAVIGRGVTGELSRDALIAYPPARLGPLGKSFKEASPAVLGLLGDMGDPRAIGVLRKQLKRRTPAVKRAAAIALAKLGDGTAAPIARAWLEAKGKDDTAGVLAAAEVLMLLDAPDAPQAIARLLGAAKTRAAGLRLAEASLSAALVPTLSAVIDADVTDAERKRAAVIVAKIGGDEAAAVLLRLIAKPELATDAAFGLAHSRGRVAHDGLGRALRSAEGPARRLVLRAGLVRFVSRGERIAGLDDATRAALASSDPADRAAGSFGAVLLDLEPIEELAKHESVEIVAGAARAAMWRGPPAIARLGPAFVASAGGDEPSVRAVALGVALLSPSGVVSDVPTTRLAAWAESGGALAPLAALEMAHRDSALVRGRMEQLLAGTDPSVRLHVALGLASSPEADAVALLSRAYRFEVDARVRRAIIRALSQRTEKLRLAILGEARDLDPDETVRALAASALAGRRMPATLSERGRDVAWVALRANTKAARPELGLRAGQLIRGDGLALPFASDPDGVVIVPGVSSGALSLRLE